MKWFSLKKLGEITFVDVVLAFFVSICGIGAIAIAPQFYWLFFGELISPEGLEILHQNSYLGWFNIMFVFSILGSRLGQMRKDYLKNKGVKK